MACIGDGSHITHHHGHEEIVRNTRRIRLFFSSAYPYQEIFGLASERLASG